MQNSPINLSLGRMTSVVDPAFGGRVTAFRYGEVDLFTPIPDASRDVTSSASGGCFPLVPWSNRIRDGRLTYGGGTVVLPATEIPAGHAIHGHGLRRVWETTAQSVTRVGMRYAHRAGDDGWPWSYVAAQSVDLDETGLTIGLSVTNTDTSVMPVGLGLHPYFPRTPRTRVRFPVESAWPPVEAGKFPTKGGQGVPSELDRRVEGLVPLGLDQGFGGWSRTARIVWPEHGLAVTLSGEGPVDHLIVYTPRDQPYFCLEPVTHAIDAANLFQNQGLEGTGHRVLSPGAELSVSLRLTVEVL